MEIDDKVVRNRDERKGYVKEIKPGRVVMVRVRWLGGMVGGEWLPAEELRVWDKFPVPPPLPMPQKKKPVRPLFHRTPPAKRGLLG